MSDTRNCPICSDVKPGLRIGSLACTTHYALTREKFDLVYCGCGALVYIDPEPSVVDLRAMYQEQDQFTSDHYTSAERVSAILEYMSTSLERVRGHQGVSGRAPGRILEVGAGYAWMCRAAKQLNAESLTVAQDITSEVRDRCSWVDRYHHGEVFDRQVADFGPYDVISITHVIEHLVDPVAIIGRCIDLLAPGGIVYITAPHRPLGWTPGSLDASLWESYSLMHMPAHVQYFSRESMSKLATRTGATLAYWSHDHEGGQAFEAWLSQRDPGKSRKSWLARVREYLRPRSTQGV